MRIGKQLTSGKSVSTPQLGNLIFISSGEKLSVSLGPQQAVVAIITTSGANGGKTLAIMDSTWFQDSVSNANRIPDGANVTAANWQMVGPWNDWGLTDNNNTKTKVYLGNVSSTTSTYSQTIPASVDDGFYRPNTLPHWLATNGTTYGMGNSTMDGSYTAGVRFTSVTIPNAATINSATLTFFAPGSDSNTVSVKVYGIAEDNTADFSTDPTGRTKTTAFVSWTQGPVTSGTGYSPADISAVVQEIVNRAGWASGNAMGFLIPDNGSASNNYHLFYDYEFVGGEPAKISITYTYGGVTKTVILDTQMRVISSDENISVV